MGKILAALRRLFGTRGVLAKPIDEGRGPLVVLLHGIGRSSSVWQPLVELLRPYDCRVVAFDLLGFGVSPKPEDSQYTTDDHAEAVLASILALRPKRPVILVGHSMGSLVAVRVARLRPDLIKQLVLYEMPLYEGLPNKRMYRWRVEAYYRLYEQIIGVKITPGEPDTIGERLVQRVTGQDVDASSWLPYVRSLQHTIMEQTAAEDIKALPMPMDVIFGSRDMLVIRGKVQQIFGTNIDTITTHTIRERHKISKRSSAFLVQRILIALAAESDESGHSQARAVSHE